MVIIELVIILNLNIASATIQTMYIYVVHVNLVCKDSTKIIINKRPANSVQWVNIKTRMLKVDVNIVPRDSTKIQIHKLRK